MNPARVLVIGAGISGLSAAFELLRRGREVVVADAGGTAGGVLRTFRGSGYLFEDGPNTVQGSAAPFLSLVSDLDLGSELLPCAAAASRRSFVAGGRMKDVPASPPALLFSSLFSFGEKLRLLREPRVAPRVVDPAASPEDEETVFAFFARRFGRGPVERFLDAVTAGVNGGDPRRLGIESAFPEVVAMEREHGSVFKALGAKRRARPPGAAKPPAVVTLRSGLDGVADAIARRLGPDRLKLGVRAAAIRRAPDGGFDVACVGAGGLVQLRASKIVLAIPAAEAAALLAPFSPAASAVLAAVLSASMAVVQTGFALRDVPRLPVGFGALAPRREGLKMLGWITPSHVFPGRAPEGAVAVSGFRGGAFEPDVCDRSDAELAETSCAELGRVLGMSSPPRPAFTRVVRWRNVLPLANTGHAYRMRTAAEALRSVAPGIVLVGNAFAGAAVPKCIAFARAAVAAD